MNLDLGDTRLIIDECKKLGLLRNQCAYVLATAFWETGKTVRPVREMGSERYLQSKPYYPFVGMGYVQLTWLSNYEKASKACGVDFVKDPKKLLEPLNAAQVLVSGMKEGWFTTKCLSDYITTQKSEFVNARRIVNGTDQAAKIATYAYAYDRDLKALGYGDAPLVDPVEPPSDSGAIALLKKILGLILAFFGKELQK